MCLTFRSEPLPATGNRIADDCHGRRRLFPLRGPHRASPASDAFPRAGRRADSQPGGETFWAADGLYQSAKAGRSLSWSEYVQQSRYLYCEASPYVASYMAQPHRLEINLPSGAECFFPTFGSRCGRVAS